MNSVQIGIIGAGNRGENHIKRYEKIPNAQVVALADIDEERGENLATSFGVEELFTDYRNMMQEIDLDAVDVCLHNNLHADVTIDALQHGANVFCEKPMASNYTDAKAMYETAQKTGKSLAVQNRFLFTKETQVAKKLIEDGYLGETYYGRAVCSEGLKFGDEVEKTVLGTRRRATPYIEGYGSPAFVNKKTAGGGAVYDLGTYTISQLLYLLGSPEIDRISARTFQNARSFHGTKDEVNEYRRRLEESNYDVEDMGLGFVNFCDGSVLSVRASWMMYLANHESSAIVGTEGGIDLYPFTYSTTIADVEMDGTFDLDNYIQRQYSLRNKSEAYQQQIWADPLYHWVEGLLGQIEVLPTAEIALQAMLIMDGMYLSERLGREVSKQEVIDHSEGTIESTS